jgi:hypothetical protein
MSKDDSNGTEKSPVVAQAGVKEEGSRGRQCPECKGVGWTAVPNCEASPLQVTDCQTCLGSGWLNEVPASSLKAEKEPGQESSRIAAYQHLIAHLMKYLPPEKLDRLGKLMARGEVSFKDVDLIFSRAEKERGEEAGNLAGKSQVQIAVENAFRAHSLCADLAEELKVARFAVGEREVEIKKVADIQRAIYVPAIAKWREDAERLAEALENYSIIFQSYAAKHRAKGTPEGDAKADANVNAAIPCEKALAAHRALLGEDSRTSDNEIDKPKEKK